MTALGRSMIRVVVSAKKPHRNPSAKLLATENHVVRERVAFGRLMMMGAVGVVHA